MLQSGCGDPPIGKTSLIPLDWSPARRWRYALKLHGWPKVLVAWWLGVGWASLVAGDQLRPVGVLLGGVAAVLLLVAIVLLNDWADVDVDRIKRRMFPDGCSPKTIPDGILPARSLAVWGFAALGALVLLGGILGAVWAPALAILAPLCGLVFVAYSLPPLRLNYRGGGELLEALGVAFVMPAFSAQCAGVALWEEPSSLSPTVCLGVVGVFAFGLASALASGLSDEVSDRAGGKRTVASVFGNRAARWGIAAAIGAGLLLWLGAGLLGLARGATAGWPLLAAAAVAVWPAIRALRTLPRALTNEFRAQGQHKLWLHRAIWWGAAVLGSGWLLTGLLGGDA